MPERIEAELIAAGRIGDTQALSALFERHYRSSMRIALRILRSREDALDAVQSAYLAAFEHFSSFREESSFSAWMGSIVRNQCAMHFRRPASRAFESPLDPEEGGAPAPLVSALPSPEELAWRGEVAGAASEAAEQLPKQLRDAFLLCCVSDFTPCEAAGILGLTVPAVKTRLFRARNRVRPEIAKRLAISGQRNTVRRCVLQTPNAPRRLAA